MKRIRMDLSSLQKWHLKGVIQSSPTKMPGGLEAGEP